MTYTETGKRFMLFALGLISLLAIGACSSGGDGGGGGAPSVAVPLSGVFVDSPVQGLGYSATPSGLSGVTDANGQFNYNAGDTMTFTLYGRTIASNVPVPPNGVVTALAALGATSVSDANVVNLTQLLCTLAGGCPAFTSPMVIPSVAPPNFPATLDFSDPNFDTSFPGLTLVDEPTATTHLAGSFKTVAVTIVNSGAVTSNPAGINCTVGTCSAVFQTGTGVTLTATGTGFTGWTGSGCTGTGPCVVTLSVDAAVTATFPVAPPPATLTISSAGTGTGSVACSVNGGAFGACAASYPNGTTLTLQATANSGSTFTRWMKPLASA